MYREGGSSETSMAHWGQVHKVHKLLNSEHGFDRKHHVSSYDLEL